MTAYDLDQPRMIYTGPLPPHLLRSEEEPAEDVMDDAAQPQPAGWLRMAAAAGIALVVGVAIGAAVPAFLRGTPSTQAAAAPRAAPAPPAAVAALSAGPQAPVAEPGLPESPAAAPAPSAEAPQRVALAMLSARPASAAVAKPAPLERAQDPAPCAAGASRADLTTCADPSVAAADRDLKVAYRRALNAGAPVETATGDQIAWLLTREDAARRSPAALASAYRERAERLNSLAEEPPH